MVSVISPELCVRCKGRLWCGLKKCPLLELKRASSPPNTTELYGAMTGTLFVGWKKYPEVNTLPLLSPEKDQHYDNPLLWRNMSIEEIAILRGKTGGGYTYRNVYSDPEETLDLVISKEPFYSEVYLKKPPRPRVKLSFSLPPYGYSAPMKSYRLAENPSVDRLAEKIFYDEIKAEEGVWKLYERGRTIYQIERYFSGGVFGEKKKYVPTRWAVTAVDSIIGDRLLDSVREYDIVDSVYLYYSNLFDNHFYILLLPGPWSFELIEAWAPKSFWSRGKEVILSDGEYGRKRKTYVKNVAGAYYASRLSVLEHLNKIKRQASVVVLREVREGYYMPLGVWQVRENVRNALQKEPAVFENVNSALEYAKLRLGMRISPEKWVAHSKLLSGRQTTIV